MPHHLKTLHYLGSFSGLDLLDFYPTLEFLEKTFCRHGLPQIVEFQRTKMIENSRKFLTDIVALHVNETRQNAMAVSEVKAKVDELKLGEEDALSVVRLYSFISSNQTK